MSDGGPDPLNPRDLMEVVPVLEFYADGIAMVERLGGRNICVTYFRYMRIPGSRGQTRVVCGRVIRPESSLVTGQITAMLEKLPREHEGQSESATR